MRRKPHPLQESEEKVVSVTGFPVGTSEQAEETYAGSWARKQMNSTFNGYTLGYTRNELNLRPITLDSDAALNHLVLGSVGQGKSVYVRNLLLQIAEHGQGFCYLDRFDSQDSLLHILPKERLEDVILFDMEPNEILDYEFLYNVIQKGKIVLFQPPSYFDEGELELDEIIRTLVDARSDLEDPDPFYLAWDHMRDVSEDVLPRSIVQDLMHRCRERNIGTIFTGHTPESIHSREATQELLVNSSDVHVGFKMGSSDRTDFALKYDLPVYKTSVINQIGREWGEFEAVVNTPEFGPELIQPFAQYPPKHTVQDIFGGPLLRYKI